jgi:predicted O-methyltransferase YrrM
MIKKIINRIKVLPSQFYITTAFKDKLTHHFYELTWVERALYILRYRKNLSPDERFFFEGRRGLHGQMYMAERKALFDTLTSYSPRHCFEIGTYTGGGSTFFISSAFHRAGKGKLITIESSPYLFRKASNYYNDNMPGLSKHIDFLNGDSTSQFDKYIATYGAVDCVFFDGAEDSQQTLDQYYYFLPHFRTGSIIIMHDWNTDKTKAIKPIIISDPKWKIIRELQPPHSVGMAFAVRL